MAGIAVGIIIGVIGVITGTGAVNVLGNFFASALAASSSYVRTARGDTTPPASSPSSRFSSSLSPRFFCRRRLSQQDVMFFCLCRGIGLRADGGASSGVAAEKQGCYNGGGKARRDSEPYVLRHDKMSTDMRKFFLRKVRHNDDSVRYPYT